MQDSHASTVWTLHTPARAMFTDNRLYITQAFIHVKKGSKVTGKITKLFDLDGADNRSKI